MSIAIKSEKSSCAKRQGQPSSEGMRNMGLGPGRQHNKRPKRPETYKPSSLYGRRMSCTRCRMRVCPVSRTCSGAVPILRVAERWQASGSEWHADCRKRSWSGTAWRLPEPNRVVYCGMSWRERGHRSNLRARVSRLEWFMHSLAAVQTITKRPASHRRLYKGLGRRQVRCVQAWH